MERVECNLLLLRAVLPGVGLLDGADDLVVDPPLEDVRLPVDSVLVEVGGGVTREVVVSAVRVRVVDVPKEEEVLISAKLWG
jgi:hypothetical protein